MVKKLRPLLRAHCAGHSLRRPRQQRSMSAAARRLGSFPAAAPLGVGTQRGAGAKADGELPGTVGRCNFVVIQSRKDGLMLQGVRRRSGSFCTAAISTGSPTTRC